MNPTFLLGVGAQKAGTTWLHRALNRQPEVDMGFAKEYHVWDAKFSKICENFRLSVLNSESGGRALRRLMQQDEVIYCKYFRSLIRDGIFVTGDITPSYCCLKPKEFKHIKMLLEGVGFRVKVLFVMRDPVERLWSAVRMGLPESESTCVEELRSLAIERLHRSLGNSSTFARSNYLSTISSLDAVFESEDICYVFYESLFTDEVFHKISDFLGFEIRGVDFKESANPSVALTLPDSDRTSLRKVLHEQYSGCAIRFPELVGLWTS